MSTCPYCQHSQVPAGATACPRCNTLLDPAVNQSTPAGTRQESAADLNRWIAAARAAEPPPEVKIIQREPAARAPAPPSAATENDGSQPFRPTLRPPMLVLCVVDQGRDGGEFRRIRGDRAVIGRAEGDLVISHDPGISGQHAELVRLESGGRLRWWLQDLQSRNGTFARCNEAPLEHEQEFMVGMRRFRFEMAGAAPAEPAEPATPPGPARITTQGWQTVTPADLSRLAPSLVELTPTGTGTRTPLAAAEHWIGSDAECTVVVADDPFVGRRHAKIVRTPQGRWRIEDGPSRNGTWLRVRRIPIDTTAEFQMGEQRFAVKVC
ncbi:MAG TPA: FHA domain-containing protein [Pirellulales bacterium]|nr:FHA domain-containing protein [Pirellulales bacterium]